MARIVITLSYWLMLFYANGGADNSVHSRNY
jgi:hypothetical protein